MIQRIQSIFLFIAALVFLATFFLRSHIASEAMTWVVPTVIGLQVLAAVFAVVTIFMYNNRKQQLKMISILQFLALIAIIGMFGGAYMAGMVEELPENTTGMVLLVLPMVGYVLVRLSGQRVKKDIELVRSMDRLRP